jgi:hypothetical protein
MAKTKTRTSVSKSRKSKTKPLRRQKSFSGTQLVFFALVFALVGGIAVWKGFAASTACTPRNPGVAVNNTYQWAQWGSYGTAGQQLRYAANVINYDAGCTSSTFTLNVTAPSGFSVSIPTNTITLKSTSQGYIYADITSPNPTADGDYPLNFTVTRSGTAAQTGSGTSAYKVYSSDTTAPSLYWNSPGEGQVVSSRKGSKSFNVSVESNDDHAVKKIETYIDGGLADTLTCPGIAYACSSYYPWPLRGQAGAHTATFKSYDWFDNVRTLNVNFTVN